MKNKLWGVLGKQQVYNRPKPLGEKIPLNNVPTDAWDYKKSRYKRIDLVPKDASVSFLQQQAGVVGTQVTPTPTPSAPLVSPSPTPTITATPSQTPTFTPTQTNTPTPSTTPPPQFYILSELSEILEAENADLIEYEH